MDENIFTSPLLNSSILKTILMYGGFDVAVSMYQSSKKVGDTVLAALHEKVLPFKPKPHCLPPSLNPAPEFSAHEPMSYNSFTQMDQLCLRGDLAHLGQCLIGDVQLHPHPSRPIQSYLSFLLSSPLSAYGAYIGSLILYFHNTRNWTGVGDLLRQYPSLHSFGIVSGIPGISNEEFLLALPALQRVDRLSLYAQLNISIGALTRLIMKSGAGLRELNLAGSFCLQDNLIRVVADRCLNLTALDITRGLRLSDSGFQYLMKSPMKDLKFFRSYANQHLTTAAYRDMPSHPMKLEYLDLCGSLISNEDFTKWAIAGGSNIKAINITWCKQLEPGAFHILLRMQELFWCSAHGCVKFDSVDVDNTKLQYLDIRGSHICPEEALKKCPNVVKWVLAR